MLTLVAKHLQCSGVDGRLDFTGTARVVATSFSVFGSVCKETSYKECFLVLVFLRAFPVSSSS